jgi:hypothetical protein
MHYFVAIFSVLALGGCSSDEAGTDGTTTTDSTGGDEENCETLLKGETACADADTLLRCTNGLEVSENCGPEGDEGGILDVCDNGSSAVASCVTATSVCFQRCTDADGGALNTCSSYVLKDDTTSLYQTDEECAADAAALCAATEPGSTAEYVLTTETKCCSDNCDPDGFQPVP